MVIRDLKLDNLRGLAIILVVLGHFISKSSFMGTFGFIFTYKFIYLFHMPLLIFVSGYLSKLKPDNTEKAFKGLLIPYLIFDSLWVFFIFLMDGTTPSLIYLLPEWGLWYLLSLFFWRTMLPAANKVKYIFWISIFLALIIGAFNFNSGILSISRTLCFFPVFLLGFYFKDLKEKFTMNKYLAGGALITLLTLSTLYFMHYKVKLLYLKDSYSAMGMGSLEGMFLRLIIIGIGMISAVLLFNIMTSRETFLTKIGRNSLSVYILQFYFILCLPIILNYLGLNFIFHSYLFTIVYVILATIMVTYILSQDTVKECLDVLIKMVTETIEILIRKKSINESDSYIALNRTYLKLNQQNLNKFLMKTLNLNEFYRRIKRN